MRTLEMLFVFEMLLVALVIVVVVAGVVYIAIHDRRIRRATGHQVGTADIPVGATSQELDKVMTEGPAPRQPPRRDFYERLGLEKSAEIRFHLYSREQYQSELGGDADILEREGFVGVLKSYQMIDGEWYDYPPQKAEDLLRLESGDYKIDEEHNALLFRKLPHGFPLSAQGCEECLEMGGTWVHLRECLTCGHVGCCDSSASHRVRNAGPLLTFHATLSPAAPLPVLRVTD